jgi:hypothetical protein
MPDCYYNLRSFLEAFGFEVVALGSYPDFEYHCGTHELDIYDLERQGPFLQEYAQGHGGQFPPFVATKDGLHHDFWTNTAYWVVGYDACALEGKEDFIACLSKLMHKVGCDCSACRRMIRSRLARYEKRRARRNTAQSQHESNQPEGKGQ